MTVSSLIPVNNYTGNGSVKIFDFDFLIESQEELDVIYTNSVGLSVKLEFGVDYSINEIGNKNGSYITFPLDSSNFDVLSPGELISLSLTLPIKQESEFENSANLNLSILEYTFDYIVRILQILNRKVERSVKIQEGSNITPDEMIQNLKESAKKADQAASLSSQKALEAGSYAENAAQSASDALGSKNEIQSLAQTAKNDITSGIENYKSLGMYLQNGNLYYRNENGSLVPYIVNAEMPVGTIFPVNASSSYIPEGTLVCDGAEYSKEQFPDLWNNYLTGGKLNTCTYSEYEAEIAQYGQCAKFGVDAASGKFKIPLINGKNVSNNIDYTKSQPVTEYPLAANPFIAPYDGVLVHTLSGNKNVTVYGYLNGVLTPYAYNDGEATIVPQTILVQMSKGDTFYWSGSTYTCKGEYYGYKDETNILNKYYVSISNYSINESMMDWAQWASSLTGKVNTDLSNISAQGSQIIGDIISPDYTAGIEKVWGETYTAETNGWLYYSIRFAVTASTNIDVYTCLWIDEIAVGIAGGQKGTSSSSNSGLVKIAKGSVYRTANPSGTGYGAQSIIFYPDKGVTND